MIIIKVMGGLGNQMQQYALYEKFRVLGRETKLDISWFEDEKQQEKVLAKRSLELRQFEGLQFEPHPARSARRFSERAPSRKRAAFPVWRVSLAR